MYGKHFESLYRGSLVGSGSDVFAVWGYVIANTRRSYVELNPKFLARVIGESEERMAAAVEFLCQPDPQSTNGKDYEGRRLVKEGTYQYLVPNWELYRRMKDEDDRRAYNSAKQREYREKVRDGGKVERPSVPGEQGFCALAGAGGDPKAEEFYDGKTPGAGVG